MLQSLADKAHMPLAKVEKLFKKAKAIASSGDNNNYAYIVGILKKMIGLDESKQLRFKQFINK